MKRIAPNETECRYLRQLLFEELHDAAEQLARCAIDAADGSDVAGDDSRGTYLQRLAVVAELLDKVGWSTAGNQAAIVSLERARREATRS